MDTAFYEAILPPNGTYCVVAISQDKKVRQAFCSSLADITQRIDEAVKGKANAYFALATFKGARRKAEDAAQLKSLFADLDCGDGKPYPDKPTAAAALSAFCSQHSLPMPTVVDSGRGWHVYWPFTEAVAVEQWEPVARAFKTFCLTNGLQIDATVTADAARILRCPGTFNFKQDPPLPVAVLSYGKETPFSFYEEWFPKTAGVSTLAAAAAHGMDDMTRGMAQGDFPPSSFSRLVTRSLKGTGCAQIAHAVVDAAGLAEPLWRAALSIAWRCEDADTAIHRLSQGHPDYNPERTHRKAEQTKGPTTCQWYKQNNPEKCGGCPHAVTSPILLARKIEEAKPTEDGEYVVEHSLEPGHATDNPLVKVHIPAYPYPYFRGTQGGVYKRGKGPDGEPIEIEIYRNDLYVDARYYDIDDGGNGVGEIVRINLHTHHDGIRRFVAPAASLFATDKLRDLLSKHGVIAYGDQLKNIMAYLASAIRNLQKSYAADRTRHQMGWTKDNQSFVVGELEYTPTEVRLAPASTATKQLAPLLHANGSLENWKRVANFYNQPGMEAHALTVLFGFAAPLLKLVGGLDVHGATINLRSSEAGTGKTTAQMVVNSIFGHPKALLLTKSDTVHARMQWIGTLNTIAVTMDEITNITDEDLSDLVYDMPQGRGRHRMESQMNQLRVNNVSWCTLLILSSNSSLYDKLNRLKGAADGEIRRLIELSIPKKITVAKEESDELFRTLSENFGVAGPLFVQHVMRHIDEVRALAHRCMVNVDRDMALQQPDRYYSHVFACVVCAGLIAKELNLLDYDLPRIYQYAIRMMRGIKEEVVAPISSMKDVAQETLMTYINENVGNTLVINSGRDARGGLPGQMSAPRMIRMRYEPDTQILWIPQTAIRDLFVSRQIDFRQAIAHLAEMKILRNDGKAIPKRLGTGAISSFEAATLRCLQIDGAGAGLNTSTFAHGSTADATN